MKSKKIMSMLLVMLLALSLVGCGGKKNKIEYGTYTSQDESVEAYPPTISLFEDGTFQFNLVVGSYFSGTYEVEDGILTLTMDNNASKFADEEIQVLSFNVDSKTDELASNQNISDFIKEGTVFKK